MTLDNYCKIYSNMYDQKINLYSKYVLNGSLKNYLNFTNKALIYYINLKRLLHIFDKNQMYRVFYFLILIVVSLLFLCHFCK